jgi:hypothetical protein
MLERVLDHVAKRSTGGPMDSALRISLNFHPDRAGILEALARDGVYRSQFETGTSNGGLGGDRRRWESRLFGKTYDEAPAADRPKYGALNYLRKAAGAAPRFGSAHFRLTEDCLGRSTFCYPDSVFEPVDFGTKDRMSLLDKAMADDRDALDDYVEAHVHGPVRLDRDVEALVLDPCFRGSKVEAAARRLPCPVEWHHGFRLRVEDLPSDYRGAGIAALGAELAQQGHLDARIIGAAADTHDPQELKKLWHCVARFG